MIIRPAYFVIIVVQMIILDEHFFKGPEAFLGVIVELLTEHNVV